MLPSATILSLALCNADISFTAGQRRNPLAQGYHEARITLALETVRSICRMLS